MSDPAELLKTYSEENARLIVLGDQMNESYKAALLEVKKYDRFARFMIATDIDPDQCEILLAKIKKAYNTDKYTFD